MRTNIVLDDALIAQAMKLSGLSTKKSVVEESLRLFVQLQKQKNISHLFGALHWEGDLDAMRREA